MSEERKKGLWDKDYTRRRFMEISGKGLAGITVTSSLCTLFGCTEEQAAASTSTDEPVVEVMALSDVVLVINRAKCTGCQRCEANCTLVNEGKMQPYLSRIKMRKNMYYGEAGATADYEYGEGIFGNWNFGPSVCHQCEDPACASACPVGAIVADASTGVRTVDESVCVGCGACTTACPWGMPTVNPETQKSSKCIACGACADGCPTSALVIASWDDVADAMNA